ncbi:transporter substrate-binding domain-containing protein [Pelomonas sp. SE-A7]|uniref:substrate-binding periplasmic protein n=1 Tax=Pelomonas sp. SE-A7 TaxID=3054953 RepID=UPI00259CA809|nr:transporter substrate-binding domain-containing protein [Pelomonas sp. SE-A7]MDM4768026.1 transporter substrate-binding domain-containing protein [Pelomonas sp. SE-A7]
MPRRLLFLIACLSLAPFHALPAEPTERLRFSTDNNNQSGLSRGCRAVLKEAYRRLDLAIEFEPLPARRGLNTASTGQLDGDVCRGQGGFEDRPDLVKVPVPVNFAELRAVALPGHRLPTRLEDIGELRIAVQRGVGSVEALVSGYPRIETRDIEEALRLVRVGAADLALFLLPSKAAPGLQALLRGLEVSDKPLATLQVYHLLHKRHGELIPRLVPVLRAMEASGESQRLRAEAQKP